MPREAPTAPRQSDAINTPRTALCADQSPAPTRYVTLVRRPAPATKVARKMNCVESAIRPAPSAPSIREIEMLFSPSAANEPARASEANTALNPNSRPGCELAPA